jgi:phosphoribosylaminoimidazole-succinocarboxamide synthase
MSDILYEGKSKIISAGPDDGSVILRFKDTATAFNGEKKEELAGKGALNAAISSIIFHYLEGCEIETHLIKVIDETTWLVEKAEIIMVEVIVRNVAAGSFSKKYGIAEGAALNNTVVEFSLKSDELGDPMINERQITAIGLATEKELDRMTKLALRINEELSRIFLLAGIRLIECKLAFGTHHGKIILCDEISPDSCRFWDADTNKKLDKDRFRRDLGNVLDAYRDVLARLQKII